MVLVQAAAKLPRTQARRVPRTQAQQEDQAEPGPASRQRGPWGRWAAQVPCVESDQCARCASSPPRAC